MLDVSKKAHAMVAAVKDAAFVCGNWRPGDTPDYDTVLTRSSEAALALLAYIETLETDARCPHDNARGYCAQCAGDKETRAADRTLYGTEIVDPARGDK